MLFIDNLFSLYTCRWRNKVSVLHCGWSWSYDWLRVPETTWVPRHTQQPLSWAAYLQGCSKDYNVDWYLGHKRHQNCGGYWGFNGYITGIIQKSYPPPLSGCSVGQEGQKTWERRHHCPECSGHHWAVQQGLPTCYSNHSEDPGAQVLTEGQNPAEVDRYRSGRSSVSMCSLWYWCVIRTH